MTWISGTAEQPLELLPYGVVSTVGDSARIGVAVGERVLDLMACVDAGLLTSIDAGIAGAATLNNLIDAGADTWRALRTELLELVASADAPAEGLTLRRSEVQVHMPVDVADYVDFYSSLEHASNLGRILRPDTEPLLENWRHLPVGYHGRAGTVIPSGSPVVRPSGQRKGPDEEAPSFGPSRRLDIELELGALLCRSEPNQAVPIDQAHDHIFGLVVVNDWSARDLQAWEYRPLGPMLGKSFATSISRWVVPFDAALGFATPAPAQHPEPLPYLRSADRQNFDIHLEVSLQPAGQSGETVVSSTNSDLLYWTFAQQIAHMTSNGAALRTGDLIATGTISGTTPESVGSLIEMTRNGSEPMMVGDAERTFLEDGDTVTLRGWFGGPSGPRLGECTGTISAAGEEN